MDCDFTHQPADVKHLLEVARASSTSVIIGSRYQKETACRAGTFFAIPHLSRPFPDCELLHLPHDATGALRVYKLDEVPQRLFDRVRSLGYSFFFESLFVLHRNGIAIEEMPISLPARTYGHSKDVLARNLPQRRALTWPLLG